MQEIIEQALTLAKSDLSEVVALETIGGGWTGHEALAMAIFSAVRHCNSFEDAICSSVNHSGDSDSTDAICGNIMGALLGRNAIPKHYTANLELLDVIEEIVTDLFTGCTIEYNNENREEERRWESKYCYFVRSPKVI